MLGAGRVIMVFIYSDRLSCSSLGFSCPSFLLSSMFPIPRPQRSCQHVIPSHEMSARLQQLLTTTSRIGRTPLNCHYPN